MSPASDDRPARQGEAWISIDAADGEGRSWLASESGLDEEIITRLLQPPPASAWRRLGTGVHFHMRAGVPGVDTATISVADLGFWLEPGRVVTVRHGGVPARKAVEAGPRRDPIVADDAADAPALGAGEGHRVHERSVAGAGPVPLRSEDPPGHERDRACPARGRGRQEKSLREPVVRGTRVAALFYSLIESTKLCGVERRADLREATLRAVRSPGTATLTSDLRSSES